MHDRRSRADVAISLQTPPLLGEGELERVRQRRRGARARGLDERLRAAQLTSLLLGRIVELPLERLEVRAHLLQERAGGPEQHRRALSASPRGREPREALQAPREVLLVAGLPGENDALAQAR